MTLLSRKQNDQTKVKPKTNPLVNLAAENNKKTSIKYCVITKIATRCISQICTNESLIHYSNNASVYTVVIYS